VNKDGKDIRNVIPISVLAQEGKKKIRNKNCYSRQTVRAKVSGYDVSHVKYDSLGHFLRAYPQFSPERFDWKQESGALKGSSLENTTLRWINKDGRFYLDMDSVKDTLTAEAPRNDRWSYLNWGKGYVDLFVTAEAWKHKFFDPIAGHMDERDRKILEEFYVTHPKSKAVVEKAIWDSHTSVFAKQQGMTNMELLRFRLGI